uniref:Lipocalin n=1 Tax=Rhipicephalus zambeziensis TaxID=60191 RepID=A0A224YN60_9ACAR
MQDFTEMLDTGEQIYVTKRTYNEERVECVYWEKLALNKTDYDFYKWYRKQPRPREWTKQGPQKKKEHLHAQLCKIEGWPVMKIRHSYEKDGNCNQHVWKSNIGKTSLCDRVFWHFCGVITYPVFKKSCIST